MGERMGVSARRSDGCRSGGSKAPETPLGVLMIRGMSSAGAVRSCARRGWGSWIVARAWNCVVMGDCPRGRGKE